MKVTSQDQPGRVSALGPPCPFRPKGLVICGRTAGGTASARSKYTNIKTNVCFHAVLYNNLHAPAETYTVGPD